jgi:hypothetical protein
MNACSKNSESALMREEVIRGFGIGQLEGVGDQLAEGKPPGGDDAHAAKFPDAAPLHRPGLRNGTVYRGDVISAELVIDP